MLIQIIGVGIVGGAQAYLASHLGHEVIGFDHGTTVSDHAKMVKELEKEVDITFVCTPEAVAEEVIDKCIREKVNGLYVIKSTVFPGTTSGLMSRHNTHICHNPEFLREKTAFEDVINPNAIVIGSCCEEHGNLLKSFYEPLGRPAIFTQPTVSEIVKVTLNSYFASLISFWNEIDILCKAVGVSTEEVAAIARSEPRVSAYGTAFFGQPFGGKCLPKDLNQAIKLCQQYDVNPMLLNAVRTFNGRLEHLNTI